MYIYIYVLIYFMYNYVNFNLSFLVCFLGEMLFIPSGWWHRVESLSVSFSVSFWWM